MTTTTNAEDLRARVIEIIADTWGQGKRIDVAADEVIAALSTAGAAAAPVGRVDGEGRVTWYDPIPEGGADLFAGPVAVVAEPTGWQPIATAPVDGTTVIIAQGKKVVRAWYVIVPYREVRDLDGRYIDQTDPDEFWMGEDGDVYEPTHWQPCQPLPPAPKE